MPINTIYTRPASLHVNGHDFLTSLTFLSNKQFSAIARITARLGELFPNRVTGEEALVLKLLHDFKLTTVHDISTRIKFQFVNSLVKVFKMGTGNVLQVKTEGSTGSVINGNIQVNSDLFSDIRLLDDWNRIWITEDQVVKLDKAEDSHDGREYDENQTTSRGFADLNCLGKFGEIVEFFEDLHIVAKIFVFYLIWDN